MDLAAVYSRELDNEVLTLIPSGWTYKSTFVLYDKESGSLWYPVKKGLKSIQGKHFGKILPKVSSKDTQWGKWRMQHPDALLLR